MSENCIFCKIINNVIPSNKIYEDDKVLAFLDINPISNGHVLVIPKEHQEKFHQLSEESAIAIIKTVKMLCSKLDCDYNILNNNGQLAGQVVKHVHFHILPRRGDDLLKVEFTQLPEDKRMSVEQVKNMYQ